MIHSVLFILDFDGSVRKALMAPGRHNEGLGNRTAAGLFTCRCRPPWTQWNLLLHLESPVLVGPRVKNWPFDPVSGKGSRAYRFASANQAASLGFALSTFRYSRSAWSSRFVAMSI